MGSFLDKLLGGALGQLQTQSVGAGQTVQAVQGQLILADPTGGSPNVSAPLNPPVGAYFGVADVTAQSGVNAINVNGVGLSFKLESPAAAGTYTNSVTIAAASRVRFWLYVGPSPGWKLVYGVF
jgi:hypothetical protein